MKKKFTRILSVVLVLAVALAYSLTMGTGIRAAKKGNKKVKSVAVTNITGKKLVLGKGKKLKLNVKVTLAAGSKAGKKVTYKSSKPAVVSVTKKGVIKGRKIGSAKITVSSKADPKKKFTFQVKVKKKNQNVTKITLDKTTLTLDLGEADEEDYVTYRLKATVTPKTATNQTLRWTSSDTSVVTVNSEGLVTAKKAGEATVSAKAADGSGKKAFCKVIVLDDESVDEDDEDDDWDEEDGDDDEEDDDLYDDDADEEDDY